MIDTFSLNSNNEIESFQTSPTIGTEKPIQMDDILSGNEKIKKENINLNQNLRPEEIAYNFCKQYNLDFNTLLYIRDKISNTLQNLPKNENIKNENTLYPQINEKFKFNPLNDPILEDPAEQLSTEKITKMKNFKDLISTDMNCKKNLNYDNIINKENINPNNIENISTNIYKILNLNNCFLINKTNNQTSKIITKAVNNCMEIIENEEKLKLSKIQMSPIKCKINDDFYSSEKNLEKAKLVDNNDYSYEYEKNNDNIYNRNKNKEQYLFDSNNRYSSFNCKKTNLSTGRNLSTNDNNITQQNSKKNFYIEKSINHEISFNILARPENNNKNKKDNIKYKLHKCLSNITNKKNLFSYDMLYKEIKKKSLDKKRNSNENSKKYNNNPNNRKIITILPNHLNKISDINNISNFNSFSYIKVNNKKNNDINFLIASTKNLNYNTNKDVRKIIINTKKHFLSKNKKPYDSSRNLDNSKNISDINDNELKRSNFNFSKQRYNSFYNSYINSFAAKKKTDDNKNNNSTNFSCVKFKRKIKNKNIFDVSYFSNDNSFLISYKKSKNVFKNQNSYKNYKQYKPQKNNLNISSLTNNISYKKINFNNNFNQTKINFNTNKLINLRQISKTSKSPIYNTFNKAKFNNSTLAKNLFIKTKFL